MAVVMTCYNSAEFLEDCLVSIKSQTYGNFICFVVDDGSTDNTLVLLNENVSCDSRFVVLKKNNGGVASARNYALDAIKQYKDLPKYICFVDSDDVLSPTYLESFVTCLEECGADYATCGHVEIDNGLPKSSDADVPDSSNLGKEEIIERYFGYVRGEDNRLRREHDSSYTLALFNRCFLYELLEQPSSLRFDSQLKTSEDLDFFLRLSTRLTRGKIISQVSYYYRQRNASLSHNEKEAMAVAERKVLVLDRALRRNNDNNRKDILFIALFVSLNEAFRKSVQFDQTKSRFLFNRMKSELVNMPNNLPPSCFRIIRMLRMGFLFNVIYARYRNWCKKKRKSR